MKTESIILFLALWASLAQARLGESTNEIHARYGESAGPDSFLGLPAESYHFQGYKILVVFKDGRSFIEALKPVQDSARIEVGDAEHLAGQIANCSQWTRRELAGTNSFELKGTNGALAMLRCGTRPPDSLVICSPEAGGWMRESSRREGETPTESRKRQRQQAINGVTSAQCALGKRYADGDGVAKDEALAHYWLAKAAAKGDVEARAALRKLDGK